MDQGSYLSRALWHFRCKSQYTDLVLLCKDGSLPAHAAILAPFLVGFGIKFSSNDDVPDCLVLPDLGSSEVEGELKKIYSGQKPTSLLDLFRRKEATVKLELSDYVDQLESKPFENVDLDTKESLHDDFSGHEDRLKKLRSQVLDEDRRLLGAVDYYFIEEDGARFIPLFQFRNVLP